MTPSASSVRVVSLVPSVSETLLAWSIEPIAVTRFCEQPHLRSVGGTKDPDVEGIIGLRPDLVVMNDEENRREDADTLIAAGLPLHVVRVRAVHEVEPALRELAGAVGHRGPVLNGEIPARTSEDRRAFVPIWRRPWMTMNADTYGSSALAHIGLVNVFGADMERYPQTTLAQAAGRRPDVVLAPSEPYPFAERHRRELESVAPVVFVDGRDLFWWGTRTPGALARLSLSCSS